MIAAALVACAPACGGGDDGLAPEPVGVELLGGATTIFDHGPNAYTFPARNYSSEHRDLFSLGDHFFNRNWVTAPASVSGNDGLGPTYNATSCSACHFKDGRGAPPTMEGEAFLGLLLRLSVPGADEYGGPLGEPTYGGQFNHRAVLGVPAEGDATVSYTEMPATFADGEPYSLRQPSYAFANLAFGPFAAGTMISPRVAPSTFGLGLLQAVPEETVLARADEEDRDHDGISGRANYVWDVRQQRMVLGRFGWKANQPTVEQQSAGAFLGDIGITSALFLGENCPDAQTSCKQAPSGGALGAPELSDDKLRAVTVYAMGLGVPARRGWTDTAARRGEYLFGELGCASCHLPALQTGTLAEFPELSQQSIRPYTDLLLHDMGPALADDRPDNRASGSEWRTPPLWGLGLLETVNRHAFLLHDGRARGANEAILWHGGEAEAARERYRALGKADRDAVLTFLRSL